MAKRKRSKRPKKWLQKAAARIKRRGTEGALTRAAKRAHMTPLEYARKHRRSKGLVGRRARFALNAQKRRRKRGGGRRRRR